MSSIGLEESEKLSLAILSPILFLYIEVPEIRAPSLMLPSIKDIKNCINVCLPENWDDHKFGDLKKSELTYRELDEDDEGYDKNQPLCKKTMTDCGKYCGDKCEDIYDYDLPGTDVFKGAANDAAEGAGGLFSGLFEGLGLDGIFGTSGMMSKVSSGMSVLMILLALMRVVK